MGPPGNLRITSDGGFRNSTGDSTHRRLPLTGLVYEGGTARSPDVESDG